ncbi:MAG TPA: hypothetical protein PKM43_16190 [Verrucomicrobiota bacterium]|nr:hypothetical protein [Verrucomicrobiota bacterium]
MALAAAIGANVVIPNEEYRQHFPELVAAIRKHAAQAKLIWATTTPVRSSALRDCELQGRRMGLRLGEHRHLSQWGTGEVESIEVFSPVREDYLR